MVMEISANPFQYCPGALSDATAKGAAQVLTPLQLLLVRV